MKIVLERDFLSQSKKLPKRIQEKLATSLEKLAFNPFHSILHTKHLQGSLAGFLSFRITREWRVIFHFNKVDEISVIKVAHRKDVYR